MDKTDKELNDCIISYVYLGGEERRYKHSRLSVQYDLAKMLAKRGITKYKFNDYTITLAHWNGEPWIIRCRKEPPTTTSPAEAPDLEASSPLLESHLKPGV